MTQNQQKEKYNILNNSDCYWHAQTSMTNDNLQLKLYSTFILCE